MTGHVGGDNTHTHILQTERGLEGKQGGMGEAVNTGRQEAPHTDSKPVEWRVKSAQGAARERSTEWGFYQARGKTLPIEVGNNAQEEHKKRGQSGLGKCQPI